MQAWCLQIKIEWDDFVIQPRKVTGGVRERQGSNGAAFVAKVVDHVFSGAGQEHAAPAFDVLGEPDAPIDLTVPLQAHKPQVAAR